MVIHQFNKLIRNKWVWGAFAIAISAFFAFDFLVADLGRDAGPRGSSAGRLAGAEVDADLFTAIADEVRGFGQQKDWKRSAAEVNREAWETYAALKVADDGGLMVSDADVQAAIRTDQTFQQDGVFNFARYRMVLREIGLTPERYEAFLRWRILLGRFVQTALASAVWASPMELDQAISDMTDVFTVKVATFRQEKKDADAVKVDDVALRKWYDDHVKELELPDRLKVRLVKFSAQNPMVLAKMSVTTNDLQDRFDVTVDKYTTKDTNGVEHVRTFSELTKDEVAGIEKELRQIAAVQYFETNLNFRVYDEAAVSVTSRLDQIAKEDGLKVETSDWFALDGAYQEGFMKRTAQICPGAEGFAEAVAGLDPSSADYRYAVVSSDKAVWLVELAETSPKHTPTFEEAKAAIRPRALRDAKADAFKAQVEAIAAKGAAAVTAVKDISTNITFTVADLRQTNDSFENQLAVARAAMKLQKGEVSEFTSVGRGKALLVVCEDRVAGDPAKASVLRSQVRDELTMLQQRQLPSAWKAWNLERLGFETTDLSSVEAAEAEE